jgi:hypothetical protein
MVIPDFAFDGNWVDCGSFACGVVYASWQAWRERARRRFLSRTTAFDFANGIALFPQTLMLLCVLSTTIVDGLVEASKLSLCVAGGFALIALLEDPIARISRRRSQLALRTQSATEPTGE